MLPEALLSDQPVSPLFRAPLLQVCIKMIRSNETMTKAGLTEQAILRRLAAADPENKKHVIRMMRAFDYRQHMCLVFEPMVGRQGSLCVCV